MKRKILGAVACFVPELKEVNFFPFHRGSLMTDFLSALVIDNKHDLHVQKRLILGFLRTDQQVPLGKIEDVEDLKLRLWLLEMVRLSNKLAEINWN